MITRTVLLTVIAFGTIGFLPGADVSAHGGHDKKILGTVTMAAADHVMLTDRDGKDVTIRVTKDTRIKARPPIKVEDITAGTRVAITAREEKDRTLKASTIEVGAAPAAKVSAGHEAAAVEVGTPQSESGEAAAIERWLEGYDAAFMAKDLDRLAAFYHPDVTIYEGGGINNGWADYRDHHLGPELKAFENLQFGHTNRKVTVLPGGRAAYATSEYFLKARMGDRDIDARGLETLVLVRESDGPWKIRHSHTSSRPVRRTAGPQ